MYVVLRGTVSSEHRRHLEVVDEKPEGQLDDVEDQQRQPDLLMSVEEVLRQERRRRIVSLRPPNKNHRSCDAELKDEVHLEPTLQGNSLD